MPDRWSETSSSNLSDGRPWLVILNLCALGMQSNWITSAFTVACRLQAVATVFPTTLKNFATSSSVVYLFISPWGVSKITLARYTLFLTALVCPCGTSLIAKIVFWYSPALSAATANPQQDNTSKTAIIIFMSSPPTGSWIGAQIMGNPLVRHGCQGHIRWLEHSSYFMCPWAVRTARSLSLVNNLQVIFAEWMPAALSWPLP